MTLASTVAPRSTDTGFAWDEVPFGEWAGAAAPPPVLDDIGFVDAVLSGLADSDLSRLTPRQHAAALAEWTRIASRVVALRMRILASADAARVIEEEGAADLGTWAAAASNTDTEAAAREARLATALEQPRRALTQSALAAGQITPAHAAVIDGALRALPPLGAEQVRVVEAGLVERARRMGPRRLRAAARRALADVEANRDVVDAHENQQVVSEEESALAGSRLTLHDNGDGSVSGHFVVPQFAGDVLRKVLQAMTAPRRAHLGADRAMAGDARSRPGSLEYDAAHHRGLAFVELLEHLPTDRLHRPVAATVLVHVDLEALRERLRIAVADTGAVLSAGEARRTACAAGIIPTVMGRASVPLDLGRRTRLFTETQALALSAGHRSCAAAGCERPFAWCEIHHRQPWSRGGATDLANGVPLCAFHHRRIHDPRYQHGTAADGRITFRLRT